MKKRVLIIILICILAIGTKVYAIGLTPTYELQIGEYAAKKVADRAEEIHYAYQSWLELQNIIQRYDNQNTLLQSIFGNSELIELAKKDFEDLSYEELEKIIELSHDVYFEDTGEIVKDNVANNEILEKVIESKEHIDKATGVWQEEELEAKNKQALSKEERIKKEKEKVKQRKDKLEKVYTKQLLKYDNKVPVLADEELADKEIDTSKVLKKYGKINIPTWTKNTQQELEVIQEKFDNKLDEANIATSLKIQNQLLLLLVQTELRSLDSVADLNKIMTYTTMYENYERLREKQIDIRLDEVN
jgi:hypothetical protein